MFFAAKCYLPGVTRTEIEQLAERIDEARRPVRSGVAYRGSLLFTADDLLLCLFDGPSRGAVQRAAQRGGIPWERLMDAVWLAPTGARGRERRE
jgi:hypothetical protein